MNGSAMLGTVMTGSIPVFFQGVPGCEVVFGGDIAGDKVFGYDYSSGTVVMGEINFVPDVVFGGDASSDEGIVFGEDSATDIVFGGDEPC